MKVDLHMHSWVSDGDVSPTEVVRLAAAAGLDVIALTDHDMAAGVEEAIGAAEGTGVTVVPGIEISTMWEENELHILGYWIDPRADAILEHQERGTLRRRVRMKAMLERLKLLGIDITMDQVEAAAGPAKVLGRPHLARALHAAGHTRYYGEAFVRFIGDSGPAYVSEGFPAPGDAIRWIHAAGGVAVWAHPPIAWYKEGIGLMAEWGIDGIECYRPGIPPADMAGLELEANAKGLFPTGGSDWHGPRRSTLGEFTLTGERVSQFLSIGGVNV